MLPGKSHGTLALAAAALLLCLLAPALAAVLAGDWRWALAGWGLLACAATALGARTLHRSGASKPPDPAPNLPALHLLEGVSGVLRDGLNTIRGFSEHLALGEGTSREGPEFRSACRFILENSEDLARFAANLQDFVRYEQGHLRLAEEQVDAADLVEAALGLCRRKAERADVVIVARLIEGLELRCDPGRIRGAVANMVLWVAGAAPAGSVIGIRLLRLPGEGAAVAVTCMTQLTGPGEACALLEPRGALGGPDGLALPIARRVALLHSGDLTIESASGAGTIARLVLPPHRVVWPAQAESVRSRAA